jgi:hypothetical protein
MISYGKNVSVKITGYCKIFYNEKGKKTVDKSTFYWKTNPITKKTNDLNGCYMVPDRDYIIVDIDDIYMEDGKMKSKNNQYIIDNYFEKCGFIVKSAGKGYHLYYKWSEKTVNKLSPTGKKISLKDKNIDLYLGLREGLVFCPPTEIKDGEIVRKYEVYRDVELKEMDKGLIKYLVDNLNESEKIRNKETQKLQLQIATMTDKIKEDTKIIKDFDKIKDEIRGNKEEIEIILENLDIERCDNYNEWIKIMIILKNEGFEYDVFEKFSKRSAKFDSNVIDIWNSYNNNRNHKLTKASLWYMLKIDNKSVFDELLRAKNKAKIDGYNTEDYKEVGSFNYEKFLNIFENDYKFFGDKMSEIEIFKITNSVKYFSVYFKKITDEYFVFSYNGKQIKKEKSYSVRHLKDSVLTEAKIVKNKTEYKFTTLYDSYNVKKVYDKIELVFDLNREIEGVFNMFRGFKYDTDNNDVNIDKIQFFLDFVKHLINNDEQTEHFLNWFSYIIQNPHIKQSTAYVLYSEVHGVGKNTLTDILINLLSGYAYNVEPDRLFDKFNANSEGKILRVVNEAKLFDAKNSTMKDQLKDLITRIDQTLEQKGKDARTIEDYCRTIMTTNHKNGVPIEYNNRRFSIIECTTKKLNKEYFEKLKNTKNDDEFNVNLFNFFKTRDLSNFNVNEVFENKILKEAKKKLLKEEIRIFGAIFEDKIKGNIYTAKEIMEIIECHLGRKSKMLLDDLCASLKNYGVCLSYLNVDNVIDNKYVKTDDKTSKTRRYYYIFDSEIKAGKKNVEAVMNNIRMADVDYNKYVDTDDEEEIEKKVEKKVDKKVEKKKENKGEKMEIVIKVEEKKVERKKATKESKISYNSDSDG